MTDSFDSVVIGAGVIGSATALALSRRGHKVLCIDRLPTSGYGSTSGSCAIIRPYYSTVDGSAMAYESHFYWQDWENFLGAEDERGLARYVNCGCLVMKTEGNDQLRNAIDIMEEIGCPYEELNREEIVKRLPMFELKCYSPAKRPEHPDFGEPTGGSLDGAIFFPAGGYVTDPQLAAHNLHRAAEAHGAEFRFNTQVTEILTHNGRISGVRFADDGVANARVVVNVAGPHSFKVNQMAGVDKGMKIKTRALRHEVSHVPAPPGHDFEKNGCVISDNDTTAYLRPETGNHILIGSEDPECDEREWVDPDNFNREFTEQNRVLAMRAAQRIPELGIPNRPKGVVELYDVTDDWIPIYDKSDLPGFYMAVGSSGNQFKNAPVAGEMMAELIIACESGQAHDKEPVQFRLKNLDRTVSVGFYSRNREINQNSSFSVLG